MTCGLCRACRAGVDEHCENQRFPGIDSDGGMAELMLTSARSVLKLAPGLEPVAVGALDLTLELGAHHLVPVDGHQVEHVRELSGGKGAHVVLDFVGEKGTESDGWRRPDGAGGNPPPEPGDPVLRP